MILVFILSGAVLTASFFFGGGARRDLVSDILPILLSCGLIFVAYPHARARLGNDRFLSLLLIVGLVLVSAQFIPLPPSIWGALPGRAEIIDMYAKSGVSPPWASLALRPGEAARSTLSILPGLALFLAIVSLNLFQRRVLVAMAIVAALLNAPIGMLQVLGGPESNLYFYAITNNGSAVGFFANRNHYAALFFCAIPLVAALFASRRQLAGMPAWLIGALCTAILFLGLSISGSRSALILGAASALASVLYVSRPQVSELMRGRQARVAVAIVILALIPLGMGVGLLSILQRFEAEDIAGDGRWTFAKVTIEALSAFFPVGAGLGSFQQLYQLREPPSTVIEPIINHAHNDWLEIGLELGLAGWILGVLLVAWLVWRVVKMASVEGAEAQIARAALVIIALLLVHSIWDYPLRTIAMSALFGLSCGLTFPAPAVLGEEPGRSRRQRSSSRSSRRPLPTTGAESA